MKLWNREKHGYTICPWCVVTPKDVKVKFEMCEKHQKEIEEYWRDRNEERKPTMPV